MLMPMSRLFNTKADEDVAFSLFSSIDIDVSIDSLSKAIIAW